MTTLYTSYYEDKSPARAMEISKCLLNNLSCPFINKVAVLLEAPCELPENEKLECILIKSRPTFELFFDIVNERAKPNDISIVVNSDIFFDDTLQQVEKIGHRQCYALSRWDIIKGKAVHLNRNDAQDAWVFRGKIERLDYSDFHMGIPGCDNRLAHELQKKRYSIINPSKTIRAYHLHESGVRNYEPSKDKVPGPYKMLNAVSL